MPRKILIASASTWSFCIAVERAIARAHANDQVDLLNMFHLCSAHSPHFRPLDVAIEAVNRKMHRFVAPLINGREITRDVRLDASAIPPAPEDPAGLRQYRVGEAAVGMGVLSSVISVTTVQQPSSTAEYGAAFPRAWKSAHLSYQLGRIVEPMGYDTVYIFSGRGSYLRPFCDLVGRSARLVRYEQGATGNSFIQADRPIHHPETTALLVRGHDFSAEAGERFYLDRLTKAPGDVATFFTSGQLEGHVPKGVEQGRFVALFTSSSDESAAVSDDIGLGEFSSQFDAARSMSRIARARGLQLVIRLHPHLQYKHESWRREWDFERLRREGVILIEPADPCDSYALAAAAHCVFTCGSTVGFECSFRGIPSAEVGNWVGARLGAVALVMNERDVAKFVERPYQPQGARHAALLYGSFNKRAGTPLPEYDVGLHPNYARIGGRIADPVRYAMQRVKDAAKRGRRQDPWGIVGGKAILPALPSNLKERAKKQGLFMGLGAED